MGEPVTITPDAPQVTITPDAQPSAISRFGGSLARGMGIVSGEEGKNFFVHPLDTASNMLRTQGELGKRAGGEFKSGDYLGAATHGIEYLMPGLGPTLAHAGDQLEGGDIAGGVGTTLGAGVTVAAASPEARGAAASTGAKVVRGAAKGANVVLDKAPGTIGAGVGGAIGHATGIPEAGTLGAAMGYGVGKEVLPRLRIPGENLGLPRGTIARQMAEEPTPAKLPAAFQPAGPQYQPPAGSADNPATGGLPRGEIAEHMKQPPIQRPSLRQMMDSLNGPLDKSVGAAPPPAPNKPIYQRGGLAEQMKSAPAGMPEGHTAVDSSALQSYKYDAGANEFHARYRSGAMDHVFGDVSPEEAQAFEAAPSKGKAMAAIQQNHPLVAKIVDGKRVSIRGSVATAVKP